MLPLHHPPNEASRGRYYDATAMAAPTVVLLAAGEGTRMRSSLPKVLHPICGRPMILWPLLAAQAAGADRVVVVDNPKRRLDGHLPDGVEIAIQEQPRGTGDAVAAAAGHIDRGAPVVIVNGDMPLITAEAIAGLVEAHTTARAAATLASMELEDPTGYGRVVRDAEGGVERVVETKTAGDATEAELAIREVNAGLYCFDGGALLDALDALGTDNAQGELYLPDVVPRLLGRDLSVQAYPLADPDLALGVNDRVDLAHVTHLAQQRIHRAHQHNGVTIVDPASTTIDIDVTIGNDTVVEPSTFLRGATAIGERAQIGPLTTIIDSTLGDEVAVRHSYLDSRHRRERRLHRPLRLPAAERRPARERQGGHVRRDQELRRRRGLEGAAPLLRRRRRHRRAEQPRRGHDHRELRRRTSTGRRSGAASGSPSTPPSSPPSRSATTRTRAPGA